MPRTGDGIDRDHVGKRAPVGKRLSRLTERIQECFIPCSPVVDGPQDLTELPAGFFESFEHRCSGPILKLAMIQLGHFISGEGRSILP